MFSIERLDTLIDTLTQKISEDLSATYQEENPDEMLKALAELLTARALFEV